MQSHGRKSARSRNSSPSFSAPPSSDAMKLHNLFIAFALLIGSVASQEIAYAPRDEIEPMTPGLGGANDDYLKFQPAIEAPSGRAPFPAVAKCKAGSGLKLGGSLSGECSSSSGQAHARRKDFPNRKAHGIMHA